MRRICVVRQNHDHHMISTGRSIGMRMRQSVLIAAQQNELRARIARYAAVGRLRSRARGQPEAHGQAGPGANRKRLVLNLPGAGVTR